MPAAEVRRALTLGGDLAAVARVALAEGLDGLRAVRLSVGRPLAPMLAGTAPDVAAALAPQRARGGRVEARRRARPGPPRRRRRRRVHPHARRGHRPRPRGGRRRAGAAGAHGRARRRGDRAARRTAARSPSRSRRARFGAAPRPRAAAARDPALLLRLRRPAPSTARTCSTRRSTARADALGRAGAGGAARAARRGRATRTRARRRSRRRSTAGHEGVMVKALGAPYAAGRRGRGLAEGQAGAHARPRRAGRGVGPRAPAGVALQPPPRRARPRDGRLGDARQDLQGAHGRAAGLADGAPARPRDGARRGHVVHVRPELVVEIAFDGIQASSPLSRRDGAALRARASATARTSRRPRRTR